MHLPTLPAEMTTLNAFLEDTCVIVVVAYLLTRGRLLETAPKTLRDFLVLGVVLGIVGLTEDAFPGARYPYAIETLVVAFTALTGGPRVALITAGIVFLGEIRPYAWDTALAALPGLLCCVLIGAAGRAWRSRTVRAAPYPERSPGRAKPATLLAGLIVGSASQEASVLLRNTVRGLQGLPHGTAHSLQTVLANGFGVLLLELVVEEARVRRESERRRLEAEQARAEVERAHATVAEIQLLALRARLHPHFLFNSLSSIAALCGVAPDRAERAIVRLGELMRRALESDQRLPIRLRDEIEDARAFIELQQMRLGSRLQIAWDVDEQTCGETDVPPFSLLTLLENAVGHGIAPRFGPGTVTIVVQPFRSGRRDGALVGVMDNGAGMTSRETRTALLPNENRAHGLPLLAQQLLLLYGPAGRLRLFSRPDHGTLAVFFVPRSQPLRRMPTQ